VPHTSKRFIGYGAPAARNRKSSATVTAMIPEVLHSLGNIDLQHKIEMSRPETNNTDHNLKKLIRSKLVVRHRERLEPYVELLTVLRQQQHRLVLAA